MAVEQSWHELQCWWWFLKGGVKLNSPLPYSLCVHWCQSKCWLLPKLGQFLFVLPLLESSMLLWQQGVNPFLQQMPLEYKRPGERMSWLRLCVCIGMSHVSDHSTAEGMWDAKDVIPLCLPVVLGHKNQGKVMALQWKGIWPYKIAGELALLQWVGFHLGTSFGCFLLLRQHKAAGKLLSGRNVRFPLLLFQA